MSRQSCDPIPAAPPAAAEHRRFGQTATGFFRDPSVRSVLIAFVLSRTLVFAVLILTAAAKDVPDPNFPSYLDTTVAMHRVDVAEALKQQVLTADVNWYIGIAEHGYERSPFDARVPHNWAFFPLFPLLLCCAAAVTDDYVLTGVALSNLALLGGLYLLSRLCALFGLTTADASRCVFYAAFFPVSYFFSLPMTESLFLLVSVASVYSAKRGHWWLAGIAGALAAATRVTGVLLLPALVLLFWEAHRGGWRRKELLSLALVPTGLLCFMLYLHGITGNPLAFKDVLVAWQRAPTFFLTPLINYLRDPLLLVSSWDLRLVNFAACIAVFVCGGYWLARRELGLAGYTLLSAVVALSSGLLQSQTRYAMVVFPMFMALAIAGRREWLDQLVRVFFIALLTLLTAMYASHRLAALS